MNMDIEKSKYISDAFNRSSEWEEFLLNLDLLNIPLEDAQKIWSDCNRIVIEHSLLKTVCINGIINFKYAFKLKKNGKGAKWNIPFITQMSSDEQIIEMKILAKDGSERHASFSLELVEDMQAMHGIDVIKEIIDTILIEVNTAYGN